MSNGAKGDVGKRPHKLRFISAGLNHVPECDCDPVRGTPGRKCLRYTREIDRAKNAGGIFRVGGQW